jgi:hypothetical protein
MDVLSGSGPSEKNTNSIEGIRTRPPASGVGWACSLWGAEPGRSIKPRRFAAIIESGERMKDRIVARRIRGKRLESCRITRV